MIWAYASFVLYLKQCNIIQKYIFSTLPIVSVGTVHEISIYLQSNFNSASFPSSGFNSIILIEFEKLKPRRTPCNELYQK